MISLTAGSGMTSIGLVVWLVIIFGFMYFAMIRPQKKEQTKKKELMKSLAI